MLECIRHASQMDSFYRLRVNFKWSIWSKSIAKIVPKGRELILDVISGWYGSTGEAASESV
jgi:hypothetical protein